MKSTSIFIGGKQLGANCLRVLLKRQAPPSLVIANPDDNGKDTWHESLVKVARKAKLPVIVGTKVKDPESVARIHKLRPDIIFCIGSMEIIPKTVLDIPPRGTINIHPALLPKYRGRYSIPHAIFNGEKETGVTLHYMTPGLDDGPIISQKSFPLSDNDTAKTAYDMFTSVGTELFEQFVEKVERGENIVATPQDESQATYFPKGMPGGGEIDWSWDGAKIRRFIRAYTFEPFPPPTFRIGEKKMIITDEAAFTAPGKRDKKKHS
jgi:methionyl-tRNA formyltransferase